MILAYVDSVPCSHSPSATWWRGWPWKSRTTNHIFRPMSLPSVFCHCLSFILSAWYLPRPMPVPCFLSHQHQFHSSRINHKHWFYFLVHVFLSVKVASTKNVYPTFGNYFLPVGLVAMFLSTSYARRTTIFVFNMQRKYLIVLHSFQ